MTGVLRITMLWLCAMVLVSPWSSLATAQGNAPAAIFRAEELEQLVAPVALYPDSLLAQVLMASTYPLEIVSAARWVKANPNLKEQALEDALQSQTWDPSVKSLTAFPEVLTMMNDQLDWTQKLGDAFLAQQQDVMSAVQRLRAKAQAQGNLKTTPEQKVIIEQPATPQTTQEQGVVVEQPVASQTTVIRVEPANPQVVYVPTYNPTVVYGAWPYPAYPPYAYYPPGFVAATSIFSFGVGVAVGSALWGDCDWGRGDVNVNVNRYNNFNRTNITNANWQHNVEHRKGVQYRDSVSQQKFNRTTRTGGDAREAFRGRAESGRRELARSGEGVRRDVERSGAEGLRRDSERARSGAEGREEARAGRAGDQQRRQADRELGTRERPEGGRTAGRQLGQEHRELSPREPRGTDRRRQAEAFEDIGHGREVHRDSDRGVTSRQSAKASRASTVSQGDGGRSRGSGAGHVSKGGSGRSGGGGGRRR